LTDPQNRVIGRRRRLPRLPPQRRWARSRRFLASQQMVHWPHPSKPSPARRSKYAWRLQDRTTRPRGVPSSLSAPTEARTGQRPGQVPTSGVRGREVQRLPRQPVLWSL